MVDSEAPGKRLPILTSSKQGLSPPIANVGEMTHYVCGCCAAFNNAAIPFPTRKVLFGNSCLESKPGTQCFSRGEMVSKLVRRDPAPTDAEDNYTGTWVWPVRGLILPSLTTHQYPTSLRPTVWPHSLQGQQKQFSLQWKKFRHCFKTTSIMTNLQTLTRLSRHSDAMEWEYYRGLVPVLFCNGFSNVFSLAFEVPLRSICLPQPLTALIYTMILSVEVCWVPCSESCFPS